jgi:hypothetical protein
MAWYSSVDGVKPHINDDGVCEESSNFDHGDDQVELFLILDRRSIRHPRHEALSSTERKIERS